MNLDSRIKILKELDVTNLDGENVLIDFEEGKYFMIKGVGNDIWDMLKDGISVRMITERLLSEYDVTEEFCVSEVTNFLTKLESMKIITWE